VTSLPTFLATRGCPFRGPCAATWNWTLRPWGRAFNDDPANGSVFESGCVFGFCAETVRDCALGCDVRDPGPGRGHGLDSCRGHVHGCVRHSCLVPMPHWLRAPTVHTSAQIPVPLDTVPNTAVC